MAVSRLIWTFLAIILLTVADGQLSFSAVTTIDFDVYQLELSEFTGKKGTKVLLPLGRDEESSPGFALARAFITVDVPASSQVAGTVEIVVPNIPVQDFQVLSYKLSFDTYLNLAITEAVEGTFAPGLGTVIELEGKTLVHFEGSGTFEANTTEDNYGFHISNLALSGSYSWHINFDVDIDGNGVNDQMNVTLTNFMLGNPEVTFITKLPKGVDAIALTSFSAMMQGNVNPDFVPVLLGGPAVFVSPLATTPEPASLAIWSLAALGCAVSARRRRQCKQ